MFVSHSTQASPLSKLQHDIKNIRANTIATLPIIKTPALPIWKPSPNKPLRNLFQYYYNTNSVKTNGLLLQAPGNSLISPLYSEMIPLFYTKADDLLKIINDKQLGFLSEAGQVYADKKSNTLFVRDTRSHLTKIKKTLTELDVPIKQIVIKARIVNVDNNFVRDLGVVFSTRSLLASNENSNASKNIDHNSAAGLISIPIAKLSGGNLLDMKLSALEKQGHAQLISSPELMTLNHQAAIIESGEEIPYQEKTGNGNTSVAFRKAVLKLKVTPSIMPKQKILLHILVNQDKVSSLVVQGVPAIRTQQIETQVLIHNGSTFVLGGISEQVRSQQHQGIPILGKLPLLGILFREKHHVNERKELLIFITPEIVRK